MRSSTNAVPTLVERDAEGRLRFRHDVVREYALALCVADALENLPTSSEAVRRMNALAESAQTRPALASILHLAVLRLDARAPERLADTAMSATASANGVLPLLARLLRPGARFGTGDLVNTLAGRAVRDRTPELARALLAAALTAPRLGDDYVRWLLTVVVRYGHSLWEPLAEAIEANLDHRGVGAYLAAADFGLVSVASFTARHFFLFADRADSLPEWLRTCAEHSSWRVRGCLAQATGDPRAPDTEMVLRLRDSLSRDPDYKVRAAAAAATVLDAQHGPATDLLDDENWHVREQLLLAALSHRDDAVAPACRRILQHVASAPSWRHPPTSAAVVAEELAVLHGHDAVTGYERARDLALFRLLRRERAGHLQLPAYQLARLTTTAARSTNWLVQTELRRRAAPAGVWVIRDYKGPGKDRAVYELRLP